MSESKTIVVHNILWSRYKADVFSNLYRIYHGTGLELEFVHISETEASRLSLGKVDYTAHNYPFKVIFEGAYEHIPRLKLYISLFRLAFRRDADCIVLPGYSQPEHWIALLAALITGKRIGVFCDSTIKDRKQTMLKTLLKTVFMRSCNAVFAYGERSKEYTAHLGVKESNIFYPCQAAANPKEVMSLESVIHQRSALAFQRGHVKIFVYVGRLSPEKALPFLLESWCEYVKRHPLDKLRIIGNGPDREVLRKKIYSLELRDSVVMAGSLYPEELASEYINATALILPSISEPWGLVVNEALYYGCPAIVSDACGCVPELIGKGGGYSFKTNSTPQFIAALEKIETSVSAVVDAALICRGIVDQYTPTIAAEQILQGIKHLSQGRNK